MNRPLWQIYHEKVSAFGFQQLQYKLRSVFQIDLSLSQLYRYGEDPKTTGTPIPPELYTPITLIIDDDFILQYYAEPCKRLLVKMPQKKKRPIKSIVRDLLKTVKEFGEFTQASSKALEDNKISDNELVCINRESEHILAEILHFKSEINNG